MFHHRLLGCWFLCLTLATSIAVAQTATAPRPTDSPATAPTVETAASNPADYSTPLQAAKSYVRAAFGQNASAMRDALLIPPAHAADVDARLALLEAMRKLQAAASGKFGTAGAAAFASSGPSLEEQLKSLDLAKADVKGDTATLSLPASENTAGTELPKTLVLKKAGDQWKIDAAPFFDLDAPAEKLAARTALAQRVAGVAQDMVKGIQGNQYKSAADAYQDFWARCQAAATATAPATAPTK